MESRAIFVDTGAWYAAATSSDPDHRIAEECFRANNQPLLTTDYIVDELLTLFAVRNQKHLAERWLAYLQSGRGVDLERVSQLDYDEAIKVYVRFGDKQWSFTDCTSYVVIQRLGIVKALSFDSHFHQFGTVQVVP